jgi:hypothetical protein
MTRSYFEEFGPPSVRTDLLLVLDTREKIKPLLKAIQAVPGISWDDTDVIQRVMQSIQIESRALSQLHDDCLQLVARCTGTRRYDKTISPTGWKAVALGYSAYEQLLAENHDSGLDPAKQEVPWLNETMQIANLLTELGAYLFATLRSIGCYTNGYLYYQFKDWLDYDMLLVRFEPQDMVI